MPTYTTEQITKLIRWRPKTRCDRRLHLLVLLLFDCGLLITEALQLRVCDVNLDDCLITVTGKGDRQRMLPVSLELRRHLFKWINGNDHTQSPALVFSTASGQPLSRDNCRRDIRALCRHLGFEPPARAIHSTRHTFAVQYVRAGGSPFHLQRCLGHSFAALMTRRYTNLCTEDLQTTHLKTSLDTRQKRL